MPDPLTAGAFARLRLKWGAEPEADEVPAVIEHDFDAGRMVDHYLVVPAPALLAEPSVQALGGIEGLLFLQQKNGAPWQVLLHAAGYAGQAVFAMPEEEFRRLLAANGVILPGEAGSAPPAQPE